MQRLLVIFDPEALTMLGPDYMREATKHGIRFAQLDFEEGADIERTADDLVGLLTKQLKDAAG
jgi:hypothetical protein